MKKIYLFLAAALFSSWAMAQVLVTSITVNPSSYDLEKGYKSTLKVTVLPEDATDPSVTWSTSDATIVTIDADGTIHYKKDGVVTITATANDGSGVTGTCTVYAGQYVYDDTKLIQDFANSGTYTINNVWSTPVVHENQTFQIGSFSTHPEKAEKRIRITNFGAPKWSSEGVTIDIKWFPANDSLYIVNKQLIGKQNSSGYDLYIAGRGYFTSDAANTSHIDRATGTLYLDADYFYYKTSGGSATTYARKTDVFQLNELGGPVTKVTLNTHSIDLEKGYTTTLKATVLPANATDPSIDWTSSDESKVTVDANGKLTYVSDGVAIIKATAKDGSGCKDSCTVYTGQYVFDDATLIEGFLNIGTYTISTTIDELTPVTMKEQTIQVGSFNSRPEKAEKRIRITNFGAGSLTQEGVAIDIKWFTENDSLYIINKQLIGVKNASGRDINISGRGQFTSDAANTSHIDRTKGLLSLDADYFYYKENSSAATSYKKLTDTLQLDVKKDAPYLIIADEKNAIVIPTLGGESDEFLVRTNTTLEDWQVNLPDGYSYTATPKEEDFVAITLKHEGYLKATYKDSMAIAVGGETLCKIAYKQNGIIIQYIDEPIAEFWAEYEANSKFYYTASDNKNYSLYHFYTPLTRADVEVSAPEWCEVNLRDSVYKEQNVLSLTMKAPQETQTERTGELKIQYKGEDILVYNLRQLGFHPYAKDIYSSQAEGGTVSGNGGQVKFMRYTNTEWLWKTNVDFAKWSVDAPEWIQATLTARTADTISLKMFVETKDYSIEGRKGTVTIKADTITMTLDITQTAAEKSMSYYNVDGALYYGTSNTAGAYTTQYMFVPYADSVAVVSQVGPGTWYGGKNHNLDTTTIGSDTYWIYAPSNVNNYVMYVPYFQSDIKELYSEWQWGGVIKYRANARMRVGSGKKAYLCAPQYHPDSLASGGKTSDMYMRSGTFDGQSIHYCYGSKVGNEEQGYYNYIGSYIHTNGVVWADSIFVPIYSYAINKEGAPQEKATIFGDKGQITLSIYSATKNADGTPNIDREHPIYQATADSSNFLWNSSTNYKGAITFVKIEKSGIGIDQVVPFISEGGDFYAELSGFNESGMDFGLYSDGYPVAGQANGQGWFYKDGAYKKVWSKQYDLYMTFNGFFPFIKTMYGATEVNVDATGENVSIIYPELDPEKQEQSDLLLRSNRDYGEWEYDDIYDWMTLSLDTTEIWNSNNLTDITFEVEANPGADRTDTLVFVNHGIELRIPVIQKGEGTGFINLYEKKNEVKVEKFIKNDKILIRRNNDLFTIEGKKVK